MPANMKSPAALILFGMIALALLMGKFITLAPTLPLIAVVSLFLFFFAFAYTDLAMVLLIIAMLLSPEFVAGGLSKERNIVVRIDDLLIVVFAFAWLARTTLNRRLQFITKTPINGFIFFYAAAFVIPTLKSIITGDVDMLKGVFYVFKYLEYFMVFWLAAGIIKNKAQVMMYLKVFMIVFAIVNIYAFLQIGGTGRVSAPFEGRGEPNTLGGYQVFMLAILIGLITHTHFRNWRWPLIALAAFTFIPFGYTLSRSSYMAILPMYLTLIFFNRLGTKTILIGVFIVAVIFLIFFFPPNIMERIEATFTPEFQEGIPPVTIMGITFGPSPSARLNDWFRLFEYWKTKPFMGFGVTGVGFVDSQYIMVLVESGVIGFAAFILLLWRISRTTLKIYKNSKDDLYKGLALGFLAGHIGMVIHAISANTFILIRIMEPYWFIAALVMMIPKLDEIESSMNSKEAKQEQAHYLRNTTLLLNQGKG